ncbi:MAG TPA: molybdopterin cofactor-binding domain-containing protein [Xanthobacteraceae bacterium]|nr:molybdopterin cofactor-binding domain-containing protein [Xanthobacteraceae bacterium]
MTSPAVNRREFAAGFGAIVIAFSLDPKLARGQERLPGSLENNRRLDAWIRINADGSATIFTGKVELGQGILTALAQIAAEELDLPLSRIEMISGDTGRTPNEGHTDGSRSIENSGTALRIAAAEVRAILIDLAAKRLGATADQLTLAEGIVTAPGGRKLGYGELAAAVDLRREATAKVEPKTASKYKIVGKSVQRLDIPAKVSGGATYVHDIRLPGMLHGRVVRPPRYGAKLETINEAAVRTMPGVVAVVRDGSFVGVIAGREEQAIKARAALSGDSRWSGGTELPDTGKVYEQLLSLRTVDTVASEKRASARPSGARVVEATYRKPYLAHASMGPSCALAEFRDGSLTIWSHTQGVFPLRQDLARSLQIDPAQIRCIFAEGAGCYGRNGHDDVALDAALLARAVPGRPVRVQWMRDDEFAWEPYGSAMVMKAQGAVADGRIVDWSYELWSGPHGVRPGAPDGSNLFASWSLAQPQKRPLARNIPLPAGGSDRNAIPGYELPNHKIINHFIPEMPVWVSSLRTLGAYANVFAVESFMDELASAAGADPVSFRLAHLSDPRARAVIEAVAKKVGWKNSKTSDGVRGRGIGFARYKNLASYVAVVAEVEVDRDSGKIHVPRATAAVDAGLIVNPDGLTNQIEGGIIQSVSWTLKEEVRFDQGGVLARDWQSYPILTMPEAPIVDVELINRPNERSLGAGEASLGPAAAAVVNAVAKATGRRIRDLPLTPARVKASLR